MNHTYFLRVMRLLTLFLFGSFLSLSAATYSQTISLQGNQMLLTDVFKAIYQQTGYQVAAKADLLKGRRTDVDAQKMPLNDFLQKVLVKQGLSYEILDNNIFLRSAPNRRSRPASSHREKVFDPHLADMEVRGRVVDSVGNPLVGATVSVLTLRGDRTDVLTNTNLDGYFVLEDVPDNALLEVSYIGYLKQVIQVATNVGNVILKAIPSELEEVVVTGYVTERKKDITGSVSIVDVDALSNIPTGSAAQALQGMASGVNIVSSGAPGGNSNIFVRGVSSFGDTQPLVLVDGVQADLKDVNANDIESLQVLKDAGAAAIYGVRGANGVIIITTKRGKEGTPVLDFDSYVGVQLPLPGNPFDIMNTPDFAYVSNLANPTNSLFQHGIPDYLYRGPGAVGVANAGDAAASPDRYVFNRVDPTQNYIIQEVNQKGTNWFQEIFDPAPITDNNLSITSGTAKAKYHVALGYFNQKGTLKSTYLKRYSARVNSDYKIKEHFRIGENLYAFYKQNPSFPNQTQANAISNAYRMMPIIPVYDINGNFGGTFGGPNLGNGSNPVAIQHRMDNNRWNQWNLTGNVFAELDIWKNLTIRTSLGGSIANFYAIDYTYNNYNNSEGNTNPNRLAESAGYTSNLMWTNILNYRFTADKHHAKVTLGSEAIRNYDRDLTGSVQQLFASDFDYLSLSNGASNVTNSSTILSNALVSYFGRVDYQYNDKYLIGLTLRRDGSSKFGKNNRFGTFPAISAAWRVSEEPFMRGMGWLNDLKLRGSYGVLGSELNVGQANAHTLYSGGFGSSYYDIRGTSNSVVQGFYQTQLGNYQTSWEKNIITNVGFDLTVLNRLTFAIEYYNKSIQGLLFPQPLPLTAGGAAPPVINIGNIKNTGLDASVQYVQSWNNDLKLAASLNITTYRNKVVEIPNPGYFDVSSGLSFGNFVRNQVGNPVSSFFGYDVQGLFQNDAEVASAPTQNGAAPGRFRYRDVDGDGEITSDDRTFIGDPNPDFTYGATLNLTFKRFDLGAVFYGSQGNDVFNTTRNLTDFFGTFIGGKGNRLLNAWTPENTNTTIPKVEVTNSFSSSGVPNSYYIEDGSFFKLRNLTIGYSFNVGKTTWTALEKLRIYVQGSNLFMLSRYSGLDAELIGTSASFGVDSGNYPNNQRMFAFGVSLSL